MRLTRFFGRIWQYIKDMDKFLFLLIIVIISCAATVVYITRVHSDIQAIFEADAISADAHEITNLRWQIVQLERENEYLRQTELIRIERRT